MEKEEKAQRSARNNRYREREACKHHRTVCVSPAVGQLHFPFPLQKKRGSTPISITILLHQLFDLRLPLFTFQLLLFLPPIRPEKDKSKRLIINSIPYNHPFQQS
jgi:hypothetical protein